MCLTSFTGNSCKYQLYCIGILERMFLFCKNITVMETQLVSQRATTNSGVSALRRDQMTELLFMTFVCLTSHCAARSKELVGRCASTETTPSPQDDDVVLVGHSEQQLHTSLSVHTKDSSGQSGLLLFLAKIVLLLVMTPSVT